MIKKHTGKASTSFVIACTALFCCSVFLLIALSSQRQAENRIAQAEFEQTHGSPAGSATDYKQQQKTMQLEKELNAKKQIAIKEQWLTQLEQTIEARQYDKLAEEIGALKQSSLQQVYAIQALLSVLESAVFEHKDSELVKTINGAGSPLIRCQLNLDPGADYLERIFKHSDAQALQTLIDAGCLDSQNQQVPKMIVSHALDANESHRRSLVEASASNQALLTRMITNLLEQGHEQTIIDYLKAGILSKDMLMGNFTFLSYSVNKQYLLLSNYLIDVSATAVQKQGYIGYHPLVFATKSKDLKLSDKIARAYSTDLSNSDLISIVFRDTKPDIKNDITKILFKHYPALIEDERMVKNLLTESVLVTNDIKQVQFLLEQGANPNVFFSGKTTLLKAAIDKSPAVADPIIELLHEYGASDDPFVVIRQRTGVSKDAKCAVPQTPSLDLSVYAYPNKERTLNQKQEEKDSRNFNYSEDFEDRIKYCFEQGHSVDACIASFPCQDHKQCIANNKLYFKFRCAGLGVLESLSFLED